MAIRLSPSSYHRIEQLESRTLLNAYIPDAAFGEGGLATAIFGKASAFEASLIAEVDSQTVLVVGRLEYYTDDRSRLVMAQFDSATGALDEQFGIGGKLTTTVEVERVYDAARMDDGKVVVLGGLYVGGAGEQDYFIARFTPAGALDTTFAGDGVKELDFSSFEGDQGLFRASKLAVAPDGKLVVMGRIGLELTEPTQTLLARFRANGSLDNSFNGDGVTVFANTAYYHLSNLAVQDDGKVLTIDVAPGAGVLRRFTLSGGADTTFGQNGVVTLLTRQTLSVYPLPDGRMLAHASRGSIARYTAEGQLDTSFGENGLATLARGDYPDIYVDPVDGSITTVDGEAGICRFSADGQPDSTFGPRGEINYELDGLNPGSLILASDGDLLISDVGNSQLWLARYEPMVEEIALLPGGRLLIYDTVESDTLTIDTVGDTIRVDLNGAISTYPLADVMSIRIGAEAGDDVIDVNVPLLDIKISTGEGNDQITRRGDGNVTVQSGAGEDTIETGAGDDLIRSGDGDDSIASGGGADTIDSGTGADFIDGGDGNDRILDVAGLNSIQGGNGDDYLIGGSDADSILGGPGNDTIGAGHGANTVFAGSGNDSICGGNGNDWLWAESGNDIMKGGWGDDFLHGGNGKDRLFGQQGNDRLYGSGNTDCLDGGPGTDLLVGGEGVDKLWAGDAEADTLDGGAGDDYALADLIDQLTSVENLLA